MNRFCAWTFQASRLTSSLRCIRPLHTTGYQCESMLATLRKKTGLAFNLCKKALEQNNNDVIKAEQWLKAEAAKHGWEKSVRLETRKASEGLVGIYIDAKGTSGVALEVNCETDFVSKNTTFKQLVSGITRRIAEVPQVESQQQPSSSSQMIKKFSIQQDQLGAFQDSVSEAIIQLGEKIKLNRALIVKSSLPDDQKIRFVGYTHSAAGSNLIEQGVLLGKYGTIVAFRQTQDPVEVDKQAEQKPQLDEEGYEIERPVSFEESTRNVCQHIIGMKPTTVGVKDQVKEPKESELKEETKEKNEESDVLLEQQFLLDDDKSVRDYLQFNGIDVVDFVRLECGEVQES